jgi:hypothetical protein
MKSNVQSPFKPCRRKYGKRTCNGKFILLKQREKDSVYGCNKCEKLLVSSLVKKVKAKESKKKDEQPINDLSNVDLSAVKE